MGNKEKMKEIAKGLNEVLFYFAICCYDNDPYQRAKVERMAQSVSDAIEMLEEEVKKIGTMG